MASLYSIIRPLLFRMDPEDAHSFTMQMSRFMNNYGLDYLFYNIPIMPKMKLEVCGMNFPNPVGIAAGIDKNGEYIDALSGMGFGFIEIGTVTPRPQFGNPKPRVFRLNKEEAIINRYGFNSHGIEVVIKNIRRSRYRGILGVNIGKNALTPIENAVDDYLICINRIYQYANFITLNISSPNTDGLRKLQKTQNLDVLLTAVKMRQLELADQTGRYVPILVKISPDIQSSEIEPLCQTLIFHNVDGVIATNSTLQRPNEIIHNPLHEQQGGLSGRPIKELSTRVVSDFVRALDGRMPVIAVGGINSGTDALEKVEAGASLVQVCSGLIFQGPSIVRDCIDAIRPYVGNVEARLKRKKELWKKREEELQQIENTSARLESDLAGDIVTILKNEARALLEKAEQEKEEQRMLDEINRHIDPNDLLGKVVANIANQQTKKMMQERANLAKAHEDEAMLTKEADEARQRELEEQKLEQQRNSKSA